MRGWSSPRRPCSSRATGTWCSSRNRAGVTAARRFRFAPSGTAWYRFRKDWSRVCMWSRREVCSSSSSSRRWRTRSCRAYRPAVARMIQRIVAFALHQPLFLVLMTVLFVGTGVLAFLSLPIEAFPDVSDIQVTVITLYPGRAPEEVEKQVTVPIEISLAGLPHNVRMFSHTQFGLSFLMLTFDDQVNDYFARQQGLERL